MKTISKLVLALSILITLSVTAQQGINYKALIKDGGGNVVANQAITVQFIIYEGVALTNNVYQETHNPNTDANGIVIVNIGEGAVGSGVYATIDWGSDNHYLNVQINTGGGLTDMGTTQFMAVPYALNAANAASKIDELADGKSDSDGTDNGSSVYLGINAGLNDDGTDNRNVAVGVNAGRSTQGNQSVAVGFGAGQTAQGISCVAMGFDSGQSTQGVSAVAIGNTAGNVAQGTLSVAIGPNTGQATQQSSAVAVGSSAGQTFQGTGCVAIGENSGQGTQGSNSIAIGTNAAVVAQGTGSIAIGENAGQAVGS